MKIDPVQEFPGNNPSYTFTSWIFSFYRLNPCRIPDQGNSS